MKRLIALVFAATGVPLLIGAVGYYNGQTLTDGGWEDLRFSSTALRPNDSNPPDWVQIGSTGLYAFAFDSSTDESLHLNIQFPHSMCFDEIRPHFHWSPTTTATGNVKMCFEYSFAEIGDAFPTTSTTVCTAEVPTDEVAYKHHIDSTTAIDLSGVSTVSSMMIGRVYRETDGITSGYGADIIIEEFDIHYKICRNGSYEEVTLQPEE